MLLPPSDHYQSLLSSRKVYKILIHPVPRLAIKLSYTGYKRSLCVVTKALIFLPVCLGPPSLLYLFISDFWLYP